MVKTKDVAKKNYLNGIKAIGGAAAYYECGKKAETGPAIAVAECLQAKRKAITEEKWADKWADRMYG